MPDIAQIFAQLGIQQPMGNPNQGQASYPNAWSGFAAGMFDAQNQANNQQRGRVEQTRSQLLAMINSIPDNEQNTPLKFKLAADIMQAGDKHWSDRVLAPGKADSLISGMYKLMQDKFPESQPNTGVATGDNGQVLAARPRVAQTDTEQGSGLLNATAGDPRTGSTLPVSQAPQSGKFQFQDPGKWKDINEVFQDEKTGDKYLIQIDEKTGRTKRLVLGKAKTVSEITAETRARAKTTAKNAAVSKGYYDIAVALSGIGSPEAFESLPLEIQNQYYAEAGQRKLAEGDLKTESTKAGIGYKKAGTAAAWASVPLRKAQTAATEARPLEDPNNMTQGDERTRKAKIEILNKEYTRYAALVKDADSHSLAKQKEHKARLEEIIRQLKAINAEALAKPQLRTATKPSAGTAIPKGTPGPIGENNDPVGIFGKKP